MEKLWTGNDPARLSLLRVELDAKGIRFELRHEDLQQMAGGLPPFDVLPEIWIEDDARIGEAREILADLGMKRER